MPKIYFLILIIILIFSAGFTIYFGQQFYPAPFEAQCFSERCRVYNSDLPKQEEPSISILLVGDIMLDRKVESLMKKNGFDYPFEKINQFLNESDGVFGNLEGPISKNPVRFSDNSLKFAFSSEIIPVLSSANFKILSLANNHTLNMGNSGLEETKNLLEQAKIDWVGDPWECSKKLSVQEDLVFLGFNKTFNGCQDNEIIEIIKSVKATAPDKFLIISMHWGEEYKLKSNSLQQDLAHKIIDAGADLIIGQHPHVVQEIEKYNDKLIFYSLGNFIFDQYFSQETQEGLIVRLEIYPPTKDFVEGINPSKILYKLFPIESNLSQPSLMESEKAKIFLEKMGFGSIIEIRMEKRVCFEKNCFYVELAQTPEQRNQGLMFREKLDLDRGMLFIFEKEGIYPFWMKNTLIPLDIIWLNENKEVVFIKNNAQPCRQEKCEDILPDKEAKYVLEINGGLADKINLKIGDKAIFNE